METRLKRQSRSPAGRNAISCRRIRIYSMVLTLCVAILLPLLGCQQDGTQEITGKQVRQLEVGMTMHEVEKLLGRPYVRGDMSYVYRPKSGPYSEIEIVFDDREKLSSFSTAER